MHKNRFSVFIYYVIRQCRTTNRASTISVLTRLWSRFFLFADTVSFVRNTRDWLIDWLIDWLTDSLTDWLIDWLTDWLTDWLIHSFILLLPRNTCTTDVFLVRNAFYFYKMCFYIPADYSVAVTSTETQYLLVEFHCTCRSSETSSPLFWTAQLVFIFDGLSGNSLHLRYVSLLK